jgi:hypothetical protein
MLRTVSTISTSTLSPIPYFNKLGTQDAKIVKNNMVDYALKRNRERKNSQLLPCVSWLNKGKSCVPGIDRHRKAENPCIVQAIQVTGSHQSVKS